jgi:hypothetical protein
MLKGMAPSDTPFACYTFAAARGQTATIKLTQANQNTAFNVGGIVDSRTEYSFRTKTSKPVICRFFADRKSSRFLEKFAQPPA